jgi:hypothetical protein
VEVSLSSLATGKYSLQYFADAPEAIDFPDHVSTGTRQTNTSEKLSIQMAPGGGYAGVLTPLP